jgi:hypothetical protein
MKKKNLSKTLLLAVLSFPFLSGCSHQATGICYALTSGKGYGDYVLQMTTNLTSGSIASASVKETYSACLWARVNPQEKTDSEIDTLQVDDALNLDGTTGTIYLAKYIAIGSGSNQLTMTGVLRSPDDESDLWGRGEYVDYVIDSIPDGSQTPNDLYRYLAITGSDVYKLSDNAKWYFNAVVGSEIHAYGHKSGSTTNDVDYTLTIPESKPLRNDYTAESAWAGGADSFAAFLVGRKLNYSYKSSDEDGNDYKSIKVDTTDKTYLYNPEYVNGVFSDDNWVKVTGCTTTALGLNEIKSFFDSANRAYASVEYASAK